jgi:hypothetical protein
MNFWSGLPHSLKDAPAPKVSNMKLRSFIIIALAAFVFGSCSQNMEVVRSGERLEDSPKPVADPNAAPLLAPDGGGGQPQIPPFVKAYFMHMWVEALYSTPGNKHPNPNWQSPLKDPVNGQVWCTDCHTSGQIDFSKIPKMRSPMVDDLEKDKQFMADLMKKWVARLNSDEFGAKAKLKSPVTCLTCHATNPELD